MDPVLTADVVGDLVSQIEVKDQMTAAHTWRVTLYARAMAESLGLGDDALQSVTYGAAMHDVGKLDTPDQILQKLGPLDDAEFEIMKLHTVSGYARMVQLGVDDELVLNLVKHHHERWDGAGYPFGLAGEDIPLSARLFAVIDTFDAMTSVRPYRKALPTERALDFIREGAGAHFWPEAVERFASLYSSGQLEYIHEHFNDESAADRAFCIDSASSSSV